MRESAILDLTSIHGFERLYATLARDGGSCRYICSVLYRCYLGNMNAVNQEYGLRKQPIDRETFFYEMENSHVKPYRTNIQTIKALTLLEWNMDKSVEFSKTVQWLCAVRQDYAQRFYDETGYTYSDPVTSYSLCEDTLDPVHEPEAELHPATLIHKYDTGPKLVYISAPLRGDVEKNIAFAKEKAREVFAEGNIPICPHLLFPPIADPSNPIENKQAMEMCFKLMEWCNEIRVYGSEWTEGMWREIHHAERMKIPVFTGQRELPKSRSVNARRKER